MYDNLSLGPLTAFVHLRRESFFLFHFERIKWLLCNRAYRNSYDKVLKEGSSRGSIELQGKWEGNWTLDVIGNTDEAAANNTGGAGFTLALNQSDC